MKPSGITRFLALCLAVISVSMLVSGALGMRSAARDRNKAEEEIHDLQSRIDEYRELSARLMEGRSYESMNNDLLKQQDQYTSDAAQHRSELTAYTAANGGLEMGATALGQARAALTAGKAQYEAGVKMIEMLSSVLSPIQDLVDAMGRLLDAYYENNLSYHAWALVDDIASLQFALDNSIAAAGTLASDLDILLMEILTENSDTDFNLLSLPSAGIVLTDADILLTALTSVADTYMQVESDLSVLDYAMQSFSVPLADVQLALANAGIQDADDLLAILSQVGDGEFSSELAEAINQFSGVSSSGFSELFNALDAADIPIEGETNFLSLVYGLQDGVTAVQNGIYENTTTPELVAGLSTQCYEYITQATAYSYMASGAVESLNVAVPLLDEAIVSASAAFYELVGKISEYSSVMEETYATLGEAGAQIAAGEAALSAGEEQLKASREEQKKKAEELDREKRALDEQEKALTLAGEATEEQKKLEEREKTIRSSLLAREEIRQKTHYGEELLAASESWLAALKNQTRENYRDRYDASFLMMICAVLAFAGALGAFGQKRSAVFTVIVTLLCQAFAFSVLFLLYRIGRGISWAALISIILATAELVFLIPAFSDTQGKTPTGRTGSSHFRASQKRTKINTKSKRIRVKA